MTLKSLWRAFEALTCASILYGCRLLQIWFIEDGPDPDLFTIYAFLRKRLVYCLLSSNRHRIAYICAKCDVSYKLFLLFRKINHQMKCKITKYMNVITYFIHIQIYVKTYGYPTKIWIPNNTLLDAVNGNIYIIYIHLTSNAKNICLINFEYVQAYFGRSFLVVFVYFGLMRNLGTFSKYSVKSYLCKLIILAKINASKYRKFFTYFNRYISMEHLYGIRTLQYASFNISSGIWKLCIRLLPRSKGSKLETKCTGNRNTESSKQSKAETFISKIYLKQKHIKLFSAVFVIKMLYKEYQRCLFLLLVLFSLVPTRKYNALFFIFLSLLHIEWFHMKDLKL